MPGIFLLTGMNGTPGFRLKNAPDLMKVRGVFVGGGGRNSVVRFPFRVAREPRHEPGGPC